MAKLVADISKKLGYIQHKRPLIFLVCGNNMDSAHGGSGSGDEETSGSQRGKKYHRHSAQQVEILEAFFKEVPHPDENQRQQLSRELGLDPKQIKFWFQNKRTQKKTQNEKADNNALRAENERILCENLAMQEALKNITCHSCHGPVSQDHDQQQDLINLRTENSRLKEEHERALRLFSNPMEILPAAPHGIDQNNSYVPGNFLPSNGMGTMTGFEAEQIPRNSENPPSPYCFDKALIIDTAFSAMKELIDLLRMDDPVWISSSTDGRYVLHRDSYDKLFPKPNLFKSASARMESSKESGEVAMEAPQLVEMFRDPNKWKDMFPTIVTKARTFEALDKALPNGSLHLMYEKMHILSPLVAPREFFFLRYIQQLNAKTWLMVDVSYNFIKQLHDSTPTRTWKLPSGCFIEDKSNGRSFIKWIEHVQVDDKSSTHRLYRDLVCGCHAYGARRWVSTLQRMCYRFACSMGLIATPRHELEGVINSFEGRRNLMMLSHRMVKSFWEILSMSDRIDFPHMSELNNSGVRVSLRKSNGTGEPQGLIVCAATSLWLPFSIENLLSFFKDEEKRAQWDVLSGGNPVNAIARIPTGTVPENNISIIQPFVPKENMLLLQESSIDSLGALVIYSPTDLRTLTSVVNGNDTSAIPILPSGYVISSDGRLDKGVHGSSSKLSIPGSLLTIAYQILVSSGSVPKQLNMESVAIVHSFISSTVQKIKEALGCGELD